MKMKALTISVDKHRAQSGFTLIEVVVALGISSLLLLVFLKVQTQMNNHSIQQVEIATMQQNLRGSLSLMEREIRMIGMDLMRSANFGVTDVRSFAVTEPSVDASPDNSADGSPILRMSLDLDDDGQLDGNETITYLLYDRNGDGRPPFELARSTTNPGADTVSGRELLAEGIERLAFAYAFDRDQDGSMDRTAPPGNNIIWAIDSDNDGELDADLLNVPLGYTVRPADIRAVQVWILGVTKHGTSDYVNRHQYSVGNQVIGPLNDHFHRWMVREILHCRNL
jgi:prepilin-type N-terminal cleavage/methylation domain-containing protein